MEAGGGWCSKAPILAAGGLHGPLKFVIFAQECCLFSCVPIRGSAGASPRGCAWLHKSALRSRMMAARFTTFAGFTIYVYFQALDRMPASMGREMVWNKCNCSR